MAFQDPTVSGIFKTVDSVFPPPRIPEVQVINK